MPCPPCTPTPYVCEGDKSITGRSQNTDPKPKTWMDLNSMNLFQAGNKEDSNFPPEAVGVEYLCESFCSEFALVPTSGCAVSNYYFLFLNSTSAKLECHQYGRHLCEGDQNV